MKKRLYFLQSFEYRFRRDYVPDLPEPLDNIATERVSSFTQLDFVANENNRLKFNFAVFPQRVRFFGLNFFNPAAVTPNTKQRGYLISLSEQAIFKNTSFLTSTVSYKTSDLDVFGQGSQPQTLQSDFNRGNYFADTRRASSRFEWQETYYFKPFDFSGKHDFKIGFEYDRTSVSSLQHDFSAPFERNARRAGKFHGSGAQRFRLQRAGRIRTGSLENQFKADA